MKLGRFNHIGIAPPSIAIAAVRDSHYNELIM